MKKDRYFYSIVSLVMLVLTAAGFSKFLLHGKEADGGPITPAIVALVIVHGVALLLWIVIFFIQSVLIAVKNRKLHMTLGWAGAAVALVVVMTSPVMATRSVQLNQSVHLFGMSYAQFLLVMYTEIAAFAVFTALAILYRKKPAFHRSMVVLATLSVVSGSTSRIDAINTLFGGIGWWGQFGPSFVLGGAVLVARFAIDRRPSRSFAFGYAALYLSNLTACLLAVGPWWTATAATLMK
jgi:hypothetical protein